MVKSALTMHEGPEQRVVDFLVKRLAPDSIVLFGSRARKDHRPASDIDLAVYGQFTDEQWVSALNDLDEEPITLFSVDVLRGSELNSAYQDSIRREGVVLYNVRNNT